MENTTSMRIAGWLMLAWTGVILFIGGPDEWAILNLGAAHAWFIGASIVHAINSKPRQ